jgi:hypothetical protein
VSDEENTPYEWAVRDPEGYYDAIQATGTMVAPILAGFAFAILVLILVPPAKNEADPLRWRDPVLALLVFSALLLILSTQAAIRARTTLVKPDELRAWHPSRVGPTGRPDQWLLQRQAKLEGRTARASTVCRHTYNAGTLLFFTAIAVLLVPSGPIDDARRAVLVAAAVAVAVEAAWLTGTSLRPSRLVERLPTLLAPAGYAVGAVAILWINSTAASRAAAAASIAVAGAASASAAIRLTFKGKSCSSRATGIALVVTTISAAFDTALLLANWGNAASITDVTAAALVVFLLAAVLPGGSVEGPDQDG